MKRRRNNGGKLTGTPLGILTAGTQIIRVDATLNIAAGPAGRKMCFLYTLNVFVNYN